MGRVWITAAGNGKVRVLLGPAAVRERRRVGRQIDQTIDKAIRGELSETDRSTLEKLASIADQLARGS